MPLDADVVRRSQGVQDWVADISAEHLLVTRKGGAPRCGAGVVHAPSVHRANSASAEEALQVVPDRTMAPPLVVKAHEDPPRWMPGQRRWQGSGLAAAAARYELASRQHELLDWDEELVPPSLDTHYFIPANDHGVLVPLYLETRVGDSQGASAYPAHRQCGQRDHESRADHASEPDWPNQQGDNHADDDRHPCGSRHSPRPAHSVGRHSQTLSVTNI